MKKITMLFLVLIISVVSVASAEEFNEDRLMASGICGGVYNDYTGDYSDSVIWYLYESGRCVIEGNGNIYDRWDSRYCAICGWYHSSLWDGHYNSEYASEEDIYDTYVEDFSYKIKTIEFYGGIEYIGNGAFSNLASLKSIIIPESVTNIGYSAFEGCSALETVNIPLGVTTLEENVFSGCTSLKNITISENISSISPTAFSGCTSIEIEISADNQYFSMENGLIMNKDGTEIFYVPASISGAFTIPDGVTVISEGLFLGNEQITEITVPETVTKIGRRAFEGCSALSKINLHDGITEIAYWAFSDCISLKSFTVPPLITKLENVFWGCTALEKVELPDGIKTLHSTFENCTSLSEITLPDSLVSIEDAFSGCTALKSVVVPEKVTNIGSTFYGCSGLENVVLPSNIKIIGDYAFSECKSLKEIEIPDGVTDIGCSAFENCISLENIEIPSTVDMIEYGAFRGCTKLERIVLPDAIALIDEDTFSDCSSLKEVILPSKLETIGKSAFANCIVLSDISFPDSLTEIAYNAFENVPMFNPENITEDYYVSGWLVKIAETENEEYLIPSTVKIMQGAFSDCGITTVRFENGIPTIPPYMFADNKDLKHVILPVSITTIGEGAFLDCTSLETVEFMEEYELQVETGEYIKVLPKLERVGEYAFNGCSMLSGFVFNESMREIGYFAFCGCTGLKTLYIPSGMRVIGEGAFKNCSGLETVIIIPHIGESWQENCLYANGAFGDYWSDGCYVSNLYLGHEPYYYYDLENLGIHADATYYLYDCDYDYDSKTLTGSNSAILSCARNGRNFLRNVYKVKIADGTTEIYGYSGEYNYTYYNFENLREFILPDSLERIEEGALTGLSNVYLTISRNVSYISPLCGWNENLLGIDVVPDNQYFSSSGSDVYSKGGTVLYRTISADDVYTVPEDVVYIYDFAIDFRRQVIVHKNVARIGYGALSSGLNVYYEGNESEWNNIQFDEDDYSQNFIHFNYGHKMSKTICENNYPDYKLTISFPEIEIKEGTIVIACGIDANGDMTLSHTILASSDTEAELSVPQKSKRIKIFVWESLDTLKPLAKCEEIYIP